MGETQTEVKIDQMKLVMDRLVAKLTVALDILEAVKDKLDLSWDDVVSAEFKQ